MGATLFRRERLTVITFRWESERCECQCCCDDLRRAGFGIGYLPGAVASHRPSTLRCAPSASALVADAMLPEGRPTPGALACPGRVLTGRVLTAFDRHHFRLFQRRFLASFRGSGNDEPVTAVCYGLYPSERGVLALKPGVEVFEAPYDGHPARRRLRDFQDVIALWPVDTPVAYWDAGDVVFQDRIEPLWNLVRAHPDQLLAVRQEVGFHENAVVREWVESIHDLDSRRRAFDLFTNRPVINGGFAAGTVRAMLRYLREADRLLHSTALRGSTDWGDQTALNLYCHTNPHSWREISTGWNYCLADLSTRHYRVRPEGKIERLDGAPLHVVHGNAGTLGWMDLVYST
jgi:hypothetical protein